MVGLLSSLIPRIIGRLNTKIFPPLSNGAGEGLASEVPKLREIATRAPQEPAGTGAFGGRVRGVCGRPHFGPPCTKGHFSGLTVKALGDGRREVAAQAGASEPRLPGSQPRPAPPRPVPRSGGAGRRQGRGDAVYSKARDWWTARRRGRSDTSSPDKGGDWWAGRQRGGPAPGARPGHVVRKRRGGSGGLVRCCHGPLGGEALRAVAAGRRPGAWGPGPPPGEQGRPGAAGGPRAQARSARGRPNGRRGCRVKRPARGSGLWGGGEDARAPVSRPSLGEARRKLKPVSRSRALGGSLSLVWRDGLRPGVRGPGSGVSSPRPHLRLGVCSWPPSGSLRFLTCQAE